MLIEIRCDKFMDSGKVRPPITFEKGLNTILGASRASNSIGKSTFLMIIDFVFGGKDYVTLNNDVERNIGIHEIKFAFQFGENTYYFSRSTGDHTKVMECNEKYESVKEITLDTYCNFLSLQYGMQNLGAGFRELVSGFFRIYGRYNYDERHPLKAHQNDTMEAGIRRMLQLYGKYAPVGDLAALVEEAESKEKTYKNAYKFHYIRGVTRQEDYKKNEARIAELQAKKEELARGSTQDLLDMDSVQAARLSDLKRQLANLRRQKTRLRSQLTAMKADMEIDESSFKRDYSELREFFPDAAIKHVEEIEAFHRKLKSVLNSEYKDSQRKIEDTMELLDVQISVLEREVSEVNATPHLTQALLDSYSGIDREMKNLRDANEYYVKKDELQTTREELQARLDSMIEELTAELQTDINIRLRELNSIVCSGRKTAPSIAISNAKKYIFTTPNDVGTGSQTRGMFLFDLVTAEKTLLPAVVQDSISVKQVEDPVMLRILELYRQSSKQFFVAVDKGESYTDENKIPEIIKETTRLNISSGHELFGRAWNEETPEIKALPESAETDLEDN
ncbi:MAG: DUF2326 domain-containing protein [Clostridiales bacterium]|nr:DUF2326 domain-containing protein [Clostridiales bacterium]